MYKSRLIFWIKKFICRFLNSYTNISLSILHNLTAEYNSIELIGTFLLFLFDLEAYDVRFCHFFRSECLGLPLI